MKPRIYPNKKAKWCRVAWGRRTGQVYFYFSDYGGEKGAREAAERFEATLPPRVRAGQSKPRTEPTVRNTSGEVGVHPYYNRRGEWIGYKASWRDNGKNRTSSFSFDQYGNSALDLAKSCRDKMVQRVYGF